MEHLRIFSPRPGFDVDGKARHGPIHPGVYTVGTLVVGIGLVEHFIEELEGFIPVKKLAVVPEPDAQLIPTRVHHFAVLTASKPTL
ncbi:hypothetical protein PG999_007259 [Apiospora kogelbergensis]|uniref:Uncharacterized protein n=1 Tax=Apiospora kogelbergensis TaxID=1337665 RepID=A0AAW0QXT2_9PEZI